jgi:hypothetical protein
MEKKDKVIIACIGVLILISCLNYSKVSRLENELGNLYHYISSEISSVSAEVRQIREDARWWSLWAEEIVETGPEQAMVKVTWHIREYQEGCRAYIHYRQFDDEDFISLEAEQDAPGRFHALLPLELPQEPIWHNHVSKTLTSGTRQEVVGKDSAGLHHELDIYYYISMEDQDYIRTGEIRSFYSYDLGSGLYGLINSNVNLEKNKIYVFLVVESYHTPMYTVEEVYLESRAGGRVVERWPLTGGELDEHIPFKEFSVEAKPEKDYTTISLVVIYDNGESFTREIDTHL